MPAAASVPLFQLGCHLFARLHAISSILKAQLQCDKLRCNLSARLQLVSSAASCQGSRDFSSSAQLQTVSLAATVLTKWAFVNWAPHIQPSCNLLTQGREDIEDVTNDPYRQPQQDMVDFLKVAEDAIGAFMLHSQVHAFTTQINYRQSGYGICSKRNKSILALDQQQNISYYKWYAIYSLSTKNVGWKPSTCNNTMFSTRNMKTYTLMKH